MCCAACMALHSLRLSQSPAGWWCICGNVIAAPTRQPCMAQSTAVVGVEGTRIVCLQLHV